ncbi:MAG: DUF6512 family protein [bacterium]
MPEIIKENTLKIYEFIGVIFIFLIGFLFHFLYEWSGHIKILSIIFPVNESVWEHLKLTLYPSLIYSFIEYTLLMKRKENFIFAKTVSIYIMPVIIIIIFYTYTSFTHHSILIIDILTFLFAVIIGQFVSFKLLMNKKCSQLLSKVSLILITLLIFVFIILTFYPPHLPIFQDPMTGNYGIQY